VIFFGGWSVIRRLVIVIDKKFSVKLNTNIEVQEEHIGVRYLVFNKVLSATDPRNLEFKPFVFKIEIQATSVFSVVEKFSQAVLIPSLMAK